MSQYSYEKELEKVAHWATNLTKVDKLRASIALLEQVLEENNQQFFTLAKEYEKDFSSLNEMVEELNNRIKR